MEQKYFLILIVDFFFYSGSHHPAKDWNTDMIKVIQVNFMKYRVQICYKFSENTYLFSWNISQMHESTKISMQSQWTNV